MKDLDSISGVDPGTLQVLWDQADITGTCSVGPESANSPTPLPVSIVDTQLSTLKDAEGRFHIAGAPVGTVHLRADGSTTTLPGNGAVLEYEKVTVSGQGNELGMRVRLLPIDPGVLVGRAVAAGRTITASGDRQWPTDPLAGKGLLNRATGPTRE